MAHEIIHRQFGAGEAVRLDIGRQHAARSVHGKDDFDAAPLYFLPAETGLRPRQRDEEAAVAARNNPRFQFLLAAENDAVSCASRCDEAKVASAAR
jgi:hypothetical protein